MKLAVISSSPLVEKDSALYAYSPYVKELGIWAEHSDEIGFMCPIWQDDKGLLISKITFPISKTFKACEFNIKSVKNLLIAIRYSYLNFYNIYRAMRWGDHIHLRCPGNIGLMGCIVQIFFPRKPKTAKYAGNWDPNSAQPRSYRLQKWILSNTFLTRNMKVLVYGEWPGTSKNIKPFFTATYRESEKTPVVPRTLSSRIYFIFVGTLAPGKRPLEAIKLVENLHNKGLNVSLSIYGHGVEKQRLAQYIIERGLSSVIQLKGNLPAEEIKKKYQESHFVLLPSKSEGWPKVVAEAMFWGCLPIATKVSCLPYMLDYGSRGVLLTLDIEDDAAALIALINNPPEYREKVLRSISWSRHFTLDLFESEIKLLLRL